MTSAELPQNSVEWVEPVPQAYLCDRVMGIYGYGNSELGHISAHTEGMNHHSTARTKLSCKTTDPPLGFLLGETHTRRKAQNCIYDLSCSLSLLAKLTDILI